MLFFPTYFLQGSFSSALQITSIFKQMNHFQKLRHCFSMGSLSHKAIDFNDFNKQAKKEVDFGGPFVTTHVNVILIERRLVT